MATNAELLAEVPLFALLDDDARVALGERVERITASAGTTIFSRGDPGDALGAGSRRPVETADGGIAFVTQMTVTLSCDHRVVDGALGAELLAAFRHFIEHPVGLMI